MARFSRYCSSFHRLPDFFLEPDRYVAAVLDAMRECGAKVLLPCHDDVGIFAAHQSELGSVCTALPPLQSYQEAEDKLHLMEIAVSADCPAPQSRRVECLDELEELGGQVGWPVVVKTRIGNSAKGVFVAEDPSELRRGFKSLVEKFSIPQSHWPFVQQFLPGRLIGICAVFDRGLCQATFAEEYLRCKEGGVFGTSSYRRTVEAPQAVEAAVRVLTRLNWHGIAHLDFIQDDQGQYKLIEINPRPWGALWLAVAAGVDFPLLWYRLATGQAASENRPSKTPTYCRWILGDMLACTKLLLSGKLRQALGVTRLRSAESFDDFDRADPIPFFAQALYYATKMIRAGSTNPSSEGMIR